MRASRWAVAVVWLLGVVLFLGVGVGPAAAQEAGPGPGRVELSGSYTLVRNEFNNHATSFTAVTPVARRWATGFTFVNAPTVGKGYFGRLQGEANLSELRVPASASFNPKLFDAVFFAEAGVFKNDAGKTAAAARIGGALDFTPPQADGTPGDVTIRLFEYSRLRSELLQGPLRFRNNNLISAGITWAIARK